MANGIDWFRWHHGSVTDPKFQLIAKKAGVRLGDVLVVWAFVLENASAQADRGSIGQIDFETLDFLIGGQDGDAARILDAMTQRGLIEGSRIARWDSRQPKREREEGNTSTSRVRAFRAMKRHETPGNASESQETPREEKRREEKSIEEANASLSGPEGLTCPHQEILKLYAKRLPQCGQHRTWDGARQEQLRARWHQAAAKSTYSEGYTTTEAGLAWWDDFFQYIGGTQLAEGFESGSRCWRPDLEWITKKANFQKIIDGKYDK